MIRARSIRRALAALLVFVLSSVAVACHLSPQQVAAIESFDGPACAALGGGLGLLAAPLGGIVAILCKPVADEIAQAEETQPAPALADAGAPDASPAKAASSSPSTATIAVTPGCKPVPIPGDVFGQVACPELHEKILAAEMRVFAKRAVAKPKAAK